MEIAALICAMISMICSILILLQVSKRQIGDAAQKQHEAQLQQQQLTAMSDRMGDRIASLEHSLAKQQQLTHTAIQGQMQQLEERFRTLQNSNDTRMETLRRTMQSSMEQLQTENNRRLDHINKTVNEQLQETLASRMNESFRLVSERLEQVYKGLGEMQSIAADVGDLKHVLSNVKTRGILGELQLGSILREILAPEQYECEIATIPGSRDHVEFAVRLPGAEGGKPVYLPIDSKFPGDTYAALQQAYETGDKARIDEAKKNLERVLKKCAKDISEKYIQPPYTTQFAVLFLPFEGLYAEVVNSNLPEQLQRQYHVSIAGPSTMAATLNALQMGFRTLAIQQHSNQVWQVLGEVKAEFETFASALEKTQEQLRRAEKNLDELVGARTRQLTRKLQGVERLDAPTTALSTAE